MASLATNQLICHRENKGVKVRIEVGPRDASQESCVLAKSQKAGSVAQKSTYKVSHIYMCDFKYILLILHVFGVYRRSINL